MDRVKILLRGHTGCMRRFMFRVQAARAALLTTAGFASSTAAVWTQWGLSAGLGAAGASFLILEYLANDGKQRSPQ